jgi:membrane protein YqaA with SNARE-associated domain
MENIIFRIFSIYLVGIAGIWKAIPVGIALKAHPIETATLTALGSITTVYLLYYFGEHVKSWVMKKWNQDKLEKKKGRMSHIMDKYGPPGLGIICPGLFGPITTIIVGLLIVKPTAKLMPYLIIGIILWSFALTYIAVTGFDFFKILVDNQFFNTGN